MKNILILILVIVLAGGAYWYWGMDGVPSGKPSLTEETQLTELEEGERVGEPVPAGSETGGKIKAEVFTGVLTEVGEACYADGECFVVVDGKHITTTIGWSREIGGTIQGVPDFGSLKDHIGGQVEVYAKDNLDGTYSLYGSEGFYVKVLK